MSKAKNSWQICKISLQKNYNCKIACEARIKYGNCFRNVSVSPELWTISLMVGLIKVFAF